LVLVVLVLVLIPVLVLVKTRLLLMGWVMRIKKQILGDPYNWTDKKYRARIKNTSNGLLPNQGGRRGWCTGTSINVFFNGYSSHVIHQKNTVIWGQVIWV
jgi:hypothetical protein